MPTPEHSAVSVVFPCLNEADSVEACIKEVQEAADRAGICLEVLVVDNGSEDRSASIARAAGARVVDEPRRGYGNALRRGFGLASYDVVVMADADSTYELSKLAEVAGPVLTGTSDMVIGGRLSGATRRTMPFLHRFVGTPVLSYLVNRACGRRVARDSQSGFRAFRRDLVLALHLRSSGMELASEMLVRAARADLRITEVETGYRERVGESKLATFSDGWRHLQLILMLAPDLLLVRPGLALAGLGGVMCLLGLRGPTMIEVGSLWWQPVFFSGIALVLGVQALLAGAVLAHRSSRLLGNPQPRFAFVGDQRFLPRCLAGGAAAILTGLAIDAALFVAWLRGSPSPPVQRSGVASLAQSLLIVGGSLASFGLTGRSFLTPDENPQRAEHSESPAISG
jgi:hypothetical protein